MEGDVVMAEIAVKLIDPGGYHFAQLVDDRQPVRQIIPLFVERLGLPAELHYQIIPSATGQALYVDSTLAGSGVKAGAELLLRPVRNSFLQVLLDKMYEEAKSYVADQLWSLAKQQLSIIFRLDPAYPDRDGLRDVLSGDAPATSSPPPAAPPPTTTTQATSNAAGCWVVVVVAAIGLMYYQPWQYLNKNGKGPNQVANPQGAPGLQPPLGNGGQQLGTGDVQITLRWQNTADLDLHVVTPMVEPNGQREQIWFNHRDNTRSGGRLDVDANSACASVMPNPVENVFWPPGRAPRGEYQVYVHYFQECNRSGPTNYEVTIHRSGQAPQVVRGSIARPGERQLAMTFRY